MVRSLVGAGLGYSILIMRPEAEQSYSGGKLVCVPINDELPHRNYCLPTWATPRRDVFSRPSPTAVAMCSAMKNAPRNISSGQLKPSDGAPR
jgi:hypothetical protein